MALYKNERIMLQCYSSIKKNESIPIELVDIAHYDTWIAAQSSAIKNQVNFALQSKKPHRQTINVLDSQGLCSTIIQFFNSESPAVEWLGSLPLSLPEGQYHLVEFHASAALGWGMGAYEFTRYKNPKRAPAILWLPHDEKELMATLESIYIVRDLINTPADDLGPSELAAYAKQIADKYGASYHAIIGDELLKQNFPGIHAIGRASDDAPHLIELRWGDKNHPTLSLIGKGVCFDTGGLNLKLETGMRLMKKDMGGAAHVLGLANLIMSMQLPVQLQVLIPAVENSVSGNAIRPGDVITMRNGLTVEIDNTDAEGRVILADAITYAGESNADYIIDFATLTGAARIALGAEIAAYFTNDNTIAIALEQSSQAVHDPIWRLPLFSNYHFELETAIADLKNCGSSYAGAITAALFLQEFINKQTKPAKWIHLDLMAYNLKTRPAHPVGGEAMALQAVYHWIKKEFKR